MAAPIAWESTLDAALAKAKQTGRMVMLAFWSARCGICAKMSAVTYRHETVATALTTHFVPVRIEFYENPDLAQIYQAVFTGTFLFLDASGTPHYRQFGYLPPEEFLAALEMGRGWKAMHEQAFDEAVTRFGTVCAQFPKSISAAEAVCFRAVAAVRKDAQNQDAIPEAIGKLTTEYAESEWGRKFKAMVSN